MEPSLSVKFTVAVIVWFIITLSVNVIVPVTSLSCLTFILNDWLEVVDPSVALTVINASE